jgi:hypothetical protein
MAATFRALELPLLDANDADRFYVGLPSPPRYWNGPEGYHVAGVCCGKCTRQYPGRACNVLADVGTYHPSL